MRPTRAHPARCLVGALALLAAAFTPALAGPVENRVAIFAALDKITGDITTLRAPIDSEVKFGTFRIRPRTCHTRPPTEEPRTMAFVEIEEHTYDKQHRRIFSGWMNAESPGLHAVEHPLFDVWLTGCANALQEVDDAEQAASRHSPVPSTNASGKGDALSPPARR